MNTPPALVKSPVTFHPEDHTYTLNGKQLSGITGMLHRQLFPTQYEGVDPEVLHNAAVRGNLIHSLCQLYDELGEGADSPEVDSYIALTMQYNLRHVASEYIVSDNKHFASAIDKVYLDSTGAYILGDIKTTYTLNREYVRWQLSVYSFLFRLQNPGAEVSSICAIWLRGDKRELVFLDPIPEGIVIELLEAEVQGRVFVNPLAKLDALPGKYQALQESILHTIAMAKEWEEKKKAIQNGIMQAMVSSGAYSWKGDKIEVTRRKEGIRRTFDTEAFKRDHEDLYNQYIKESPTSGSVTIKEIKDKQ